MTQDDGTDPGERYLRPSDWYGWLPDELGHDVDVTTTLFKSATIAVVLDGAHVGHFGVHLRLRWILRKLDSDEQSWEDVRRIAYEESEDEVKERDAGLTVSIRAGHDYASSTADSFQHDKAPSGPVLSRWFGTTISGHQQRVHGETRLWLYPVPPSESFYLTCEWRSMGLPATTMVVDNRPILEARQRASWIWPEDE